MEEDQPLLEWVMEEWMWKGELSSIQSNNDLGGPGKSVMGLPQNSVEQSGNDGGVEILHSVHHLYLPSLNDCLGKYD